MSALPSSKKTHSERNKAILRQLLKENENKSCADCKTAKNPRWASWNLGCFVCIRCSGIHRSMGTHISRVKSVDLDAWTDEQVESMLSWGNNKCNAYWEAKLPDGYIPDASKIENFIRTKYDLKKWVSGENLDSFAKSAVKSAPKPPPQPSVPASQPASLLLDDDFGDFSSASTTPLQTPKPVASPPVAAAPQRAHTVQNTRSSGQSSISAQNSGVKPQNLSAQSTGPAQNGRTDLKKSILSLYSSPSSSTSSFNQAQPQNLAQPRQTGQSGSVSSVTASLSSLNFTPKPAKPAPQLQQQPLQPLQPQSSQPPSKPLQSQPSSQSVQSPEPENQWNQWNSSSSLNQWNVTQPIASTTSVSSPLDDDLFKNVWG